MQSPKTAHEIMVTNLFLLSPHEHVCDGINGLLKYNITGAPVVGLNREYLGVFSEKCCMNVLGVMAQSACDDTNDCSVTAREFMTTKLVTLKPETDAFEAIDSLLKHRISGAPVLDDEGRFLGVFSEKDSMRAVLAAAYEQRPSASINSIMNLDLDRTVSPEANLFEIAKLFIETPYRRLAVVENERLLGQISRRDVLKAEQKFSAKIRHRINALAHEITALNAYSESEETEKGEPNSIAFFMDRSAKTISEETNFLSIAQIFLDTPYRRLPVIADGKLLGQVSRRDVLRAINELTTFEPVREKSLLYLSSLVDRNNAPQFK